MIRGAMVRLRDVLFGRLDRRSDELQAALARHESSVALRRHAVDEARRALRQHAAAWTIDDGMAGPFPDGGEGR
jgi:hypothetical protein